MSRVLIIDNYDSFTYNLVQTVRWLGADVVVRRNDASTVDEALATRPTHIIVSPGPGRPEDAGISINLVLAAAGRVPVLGVCLGHQALAAAFGGRVGRAAALMHGKSSRVYHDGRGLYEGLPNPLSAGRYHSLTVHEGGLPDELAISAYTSDGEIMGLRHRDFCLDGVQFHPESILTPEGDRLLRNFLELGARRREAA